MKQFTNLSKQEKEELLKFPAYISLLASNSDGQLDQSEEKSAIKFSHIKTFSSDPLLTEFYKEADRLFKTNIEKIDKGLPDEMKKREVVIKHELLNFDKIVLKLGQEYASIMHRSMRSFKDHVSKAHHNVLIDFIFPMPIKGLSD